MKKPNFSLRSNFTLFSPFTKNLQNQRTTYTNSSINQKHINTRDPFFFATALKLSSNTQDSLLGTHIHAHIFKLGFSNDTFSMNNLLWMYSKCRLLAHALRVFDEMTERRNLVSWTSMISGSTRNSEYELGLELYLEMMRYGHCPNEFALASVLSACIALEAVRFGCSVHSVAVKMGLDKNSYVGSSLICLYAKNGNIEAAEIAFACIETRDLACWNAMAECYASNGYGCEVMRSVLLIHQKGLVADQFTLLSALKGCLITNCINFGRQIHSLAIHSGFQYCSEVMNSLMDMYFTMDMKDSAMNVFRKIRIKDHISWNIVINGVAHEGDMREVMGLLTQMLQSNIKPNQITFSVLFRLCGTRDNLRLGLQFCSIAYHLGYFDDVTVANSLINMFLKFGMMNHTYSMFSCLHNRNIITWNEMISGYNLNGFSTEAFQLFSTMINVNIKADEFTYLSVLGSCQGVQHQKAGEQIHSNIIKSGYHSSSYVQCSLINAYKKFGLVSNCYKIFEDVKTLDLVTWGSMISALSKQGYSNEALSLLNSLREARGENPDEFILGSSLNACANDSTLNQLRGLHSHVVKAGYENHVCVASAIIDAYAKCGDISSSKKAFDTISLDSDAIIFNTMITAYAHHGLIEEAIQLFKRMMWANLTPTQATFVAIISACSHLGLVEQGKFFFDSISCEHGMHPSRDNFACLVDLYARNGLLKKAREVIERMPYEPWPAIWRCLLSGCRTHWDKETGEVAAGRILELSLSNDGGHVLFSNVYAGDERWDEAEKVRMRMENKGIQKVPGFSMIEM